MPKTLASIQDLLETNDRTNWGEILERDLKHLYCDTEDNRRKHKALVQHCWEDCAKLLAAGRLKEIEIDLDTIITARVLLGNQNMSGLDQITAELLLLLDQTQLKAWIVVCF